MVDDRKRWLREQFYFLAVAKVMQSITPDVRVECTWYFLDYLVKKAEAEGIEVTAKRNFCFALKMSNNRSRSVLMSWMTSSGHIGSFLSSMSWQASVAGASRTAPPLSASFSTLFFFLQKKKKIVFSTSVPSYLLLESPEWTQRQSFFLSLGFETNFVNSQNYMDKLNNYFASYVPP